MPFGGTPSGTVERCQLQSINLSSQHSSSGDGVSGGEDEAAVGSVESSASSSLKSLQSKNWKTFVEGQSPVVFLSKITSNAFGSLPFGPSVLRVISFPRLAHR